ETAEAARAMAEAMQHGAATAAQASELARSATDAAQASGAAVGEVIDTMHRIAGASARIAEINGLIDSIAAQTSLLALNAAVEAAHAGDAGHGFATVAGEVRALAQRSAAAASEVRQLVTQSVAQSEAGSRQAAVAADAMRRLVEEVGRVGQLLSRVSEGTRQQSIDVTQMRAAVEALDHVTRENAALVDESARAAHDMLARTERLNEAIRVFDRA